MIQRPHGVVRATDDRRATGCRPNHVPCRRLSPRWCARSTDLGKSLLAALTPLAAPARPAPHVACACGQIARYVRMRLATGATVLGHVTLERAISRCPPCGT